MMRRFWATCTLLFSLASAAYAASTFSPGLGLENCTPGDAVCFSTWGTKENTARLMLDSYVDGILTLNVPAHLGYPTIILSVQPGATSESLSRLYVLTGIMTQNATILFPQGVPRFFAVTNNTTGAFSISLGANNGSGAAAGTTQTIAQGQTLDFYSDGTNVNTETTIPGGAAGGDLGGSYPNPTVNGTHLAAPLPMPQGGTGTAAAGAAGQVFVTSSTTAGNYQVAPGHGQVKLALNSGTQVGLCPWGGNQMRIAGLYYGVPSGCVLGNFGSTFVNGVGGQSLVNATVYNVFLFNNGGTLALDFWSNTDGGHGQDNAAGNIGTEVRKDHLNNLDNSRSLVGKVLTSGGGFVGNFIANTGADQIGLLNWFNRITLGGYNFNNSNVATAAAPGSPINITGATSSALSWGDSPIAMVATSIIESDTNFCGGVLYPTADGITHSSVGEAEMEQTGVPATLTAQFAILFSEGLHVFTLKGATTGCGTVTFFGGGDTGFHFSGISG